MAKRKKEDSVESVEVVEYQEFTEVQDINKRFQGHVRIAPLPQEYNIAGSRPRAIPGGTHRFGILKDRSGRYKTGHKDITELRNLYPELELVDKEGKLISDFWDNMYINIPNNGKVFDLSQPVDRLQYNIIRSGNYDFIASSLEEIANHQNAIFYIIDEEAEANVKNKKLERKANALHTLYTKLSPQEIMDFSVLYGYDPRNMKPDIARMRLATDIEKHPDRFLNLVADKKRTAEILLVKKALTYKVFIRRENGIYYNKTLLGTTEESTADNLQLRENEDMRINTIKLVEEAEKFGA